MCRIEMTLLVKPLWGPRGGGGLGLHCISESFGIFEATGAPLTERICGLRQNLEWGEAQVIQRLRTNLNILKPIKLGNLLKEGLGAAAAA